MNLVHFRIGVEKNKLQYVASVGSRQQHHKQQKFHSLPKRYKQIRRFKQIKALRWELVCLGTNSRRRAFAWSVESVCIV